MSWRRRWKRLRRRLRAAVRTARGVPTGYIQVGTLPWNPHLYFQEDAENLTINVKVGRELLNEDYLGMVDRLVGNAASNAAIEAVRKRCRASA